MHRPAASSTSFLRLALWWLPGLVFVLLARTALAEAPVMPHRSPHETVGTVNCASSTCHGSITPWEASPVLQNEYTTWSRLDLHTNANEVLKNATSARIVRNLGYREPATEVKICLECHAHNPPPAQRGARFVQ